MRKGTGGKEVKCVNTAVKSTESRCVCGMKWHRVYKPRGRVYKVQRICPACGRIEDVGYTSDPPQR